MLGTHDLGLFIASGLLLNMTPGPDSLLIMARSATQGFRAGSAAALGIGAGTCIHILAAALGLSALLSASTAAFTVVKLLGAAYLIYLGAGMLFKRRAAADRTGPAPGAHTTANTATPTAAHTATMTWRWRQAEARRRSRPRRPPPRCERSSRRAS